MPWDPCDTLSTLCYIGGGAGGDGGQGSVAPPNKNVLFGTENTFTDAFDITCDIGDFRAPIFRPQSTQKLLI